MFNRKKTSLWHGTVAGVLSSGCPAIFSSGAQELKESGWWRLVEMKPPVIAKSGMILTLCILMDFPIHIDAINMQVPIVYKKGSQVEFSK